MSVVKAAAVRLVLMKLPHRAQGERLLTSFSPPHQRDLQWPTVLELVECPGLRENSLLVDLSALVIGPAHT